MGSVEWLEETAKYSKDKTERLSKQIILCKLKLLRQIITKYDLPRHLSAGLQQRRATKKAQNEASNLHPRKQQPLTGRFTPSLAKPANISNELPNHALFREVDSSKIAIAAAYLSSAANNPASSSSSSFPAKSSASDLRPISSQSQNISPRSHLTTVNLKMSNFKWKKSWPTSATILTRSFGPLPSEGLNQPYSSDMSSLNSLLW